MSVNASEAFGQGPVTYHRVMGAILLYFAMGLFFATLHFIARRFTPFRAPGFVFDEIQ